MCAEIAVGRAKHVDEVARAGRETFSHAEVVFEDLFRRGGNVCWTVEKMLDDVRSQRLETRIRIATLLHFRRQGSLQKFSREMQAKQEYSFTVCFRGPLLQRRPVQIVARDQLGNVANPAEPFPQMA